MEENQQCIVVKQSAKKWSNKGSNKTEVDADVENTAEKQ